MKVAIVNDMPLAVEGLKRAIQKNGRHKIAWIARNGKEAVDQCTRLIPDLILMDLVMPGMNGVEATSQIMKATPCPILIVTASVNQHSAMVFEAMGNGALDAVNTPLLAGKQAQDGREALLHKISTIGVLTGVSRRIVPGTPLPMAKAFWFSKKKTLLAIGASSGGPQALAVLLRNLPETFSMSVIVVQHVDMQFAQGLADWLDQQTALPVRIALDGDCPKPGEILVAGSNDHLVMDDKGLLRYQTEPEDMPYRPSVDVFWKSLLKHWNGPLTAVLLTGMGKDGAQGMLELRKNGAHTIAQDEASCAVYGMPKAAASLGAAAEVCSIDDMTSAIIRQQEKTVS
jgi:two-component system response regulator WspF